MKHSFVVTLCLLFSSYTSFVQTQMVPYISTTREETPTTMILEDVIGDWQSAIESEDTKELLRLVMRDKDKNYFLELLAVEDMYGYNALHAAANQEDLTLVTALLSSIPADKKKEYISRETCMKRDRSINEILTPLYLAACNTLPFKPRNIEQQKALFTLLYHQGADITKLRAMDIYDEEHLTKEMVGFEKLKDSNGDGKYPRFVPAMKKYIEELLATSPALS
jgi:hypothetical protein